MVLIFKETREHMVVLLRISSSAAVTMPTDPYVVVVWLIMKSRIKQLMEDKNAKTNVFSNECLCQQ